MSLIPVYRIPQTPRALIMTAIAVIVAVAIRHHALDHKKRLPANDGNPAKAGAFRAAKSALDQSIETLTIDPDWRDGLETIMLEQGVVDVQIFDGTDDGRGLYDPQIPPGYVRVVATGKTGGESVSLEGFWSRQADPFAYVLLAGDGIDIGPYIGQSCVIIGDVHANAAGGGSLDVNSGATVYGNTTGTAGVVVGTPHSTSPAVVFGRLSGTDVVIEDTGELRDFENLNEAAVGFDLDLDGKTDNVFASKNQTTLTAGRSVVSGGVTLSDGDTDYRIAMGSSPVRLRSPGSGIREHPLPDFAAYYHLTTGSLTYPAASEHVTTPIPGDGDGHYFQSASTFLDWIRNCYPKNGVCWRCAGDGRVGPDETARCPGCGASSRQPMIEIVGVFYIDDDVLDLSELGTHLVVHGTIVVAEGNPHGWPQKSFGAMGT
ncbi:MAG: hypothetical protein JSW50_02360, partial [Candidatus Latescibacterota bacterium]